MSTTLHRQQTIHVIDCAICQLEFGITEAFRARRVDDGHEFYCPAGHRNSYSGVSTARKLANAERAAANALEEARIARIEADKAKREATTLKREATTLKREATTAAKRAKAALCPVPGCKRSFVQLDRHLHAKHPEYAHETAR